MSTGTRHQPQTIEATLPAHSKQADDTAAPSKPHPSPARLALLDWALLSLSLLLLVVIGSHLLHAAHHESHRIHHAPIFGDSAAVTLTRRSRTVAQPPTASAVPTPVAAESPAGRHLLATAAPVRVGVPRSPLYPFDSSDHRDKMYKQWADEFEALSRKKEDARQAFVELLQPAVSKYDVHAAPLGSTNYCVAGFDGRQDPDFIFVLRHTFHMLGMDPAMQANTVKNGGVLWSLVLWVTPENEKCQCSSTSEFADGAEWNGGELCFGRITVQRLCLPAVLCYSFVCQGLLNS